MGCNECGQKIGQALLSYLQNFDYICVNIKSAPSTLTAVKTHGAFSPSLFSATQEPDARGLIQSEAQMLPRK